MIVSSVLLPDPEGPIKETSLASQVGVYELMQAGKYFNNIGVSPMLAFGTCLLIYFALSYPLTLLGLRIERNLKARFRRPGAEVDIRPPLATGI